MGCARRSGPRNCRSSKAAPRGRFPSAAELPELVVGREHGVRLDVGDGRVAVVRAGRPGAGQLGQLGGDRPHLGLVDHIGRDGPEVVIGLLELRGQRARDGLVLLVVQLLGESRDLLLQQVDVGRSAVVVDGDRIGGARVEDPHEQVLHTSRDVGLRGGQESLVRVGCRDARSRAGARAEGSRRRTVAGRGLGVRSGGECRHGLRVGDQLGDAREQVLLHLATHGGVIQEVVDVGGDLVAGLLDLLVGGGVAGGGVEQRACHGSVLLGTLCGSGNEY